jgi:NodT family efflux transporter outer membrane factor (OMF) lipoprotein
MVNRWTLLAAVLLGLCFSSCMVGPNYHTPSAKVDAAWPTNSAVSTQPVNPGDAYWWRSFNDETLNTLVELAYSNNLSLQIAGVRVLQARAQLSETIGNLFPQQQGLSGSLNYTRLNSSVVDSLPGFTPNYAADQLLFGATWEIDFWGKFRRGIQSAGATFGQSVASYDDALVTLIADVAKNYVAYRTIEERMRVATTNGITQRESLRIATVQFQYGETSELDMRQAATVCSQTEAEIPRLRHALNEARNSLAVLLGQTPEETARLLSAPGKIPVVPMQVTVGIPRDLLRRRPDVRAAGLAAASQSALIGVAKANMYPAFSLSGAFGFASSNEGKNSLADIFMWQNRAVQGGGSFFFPVFNYGRLVNQVRVQDASFQQSILTYQNTVLTAQQEVENGLSAFYNQQLVLTNLLAAAANARRATELSIVEYKGGEDDYTTVLSAEQTQLSVEDAVATAKGSVVLGLISIYRALGGGWEIRQGHDVLPDSVKAEMAKRTNWGKMLEREHHLPKNSPGP